LSKSFVPDEDLHAELSIPRLPSRTQAQAVEMAINGSGIRDTVREKWLFPISRGSHYM
jgi:hypothetical protein